MDGKLGVMRGVGFVALWIYLFSLAGLINETSLQLFDLKPYSTTLAGPVMALALLISGNILRGLRTVSGVLWLIMLVFMAGSLPLSVWKSDSLLQWIDYSLHVFPLFFFICAAVITVKQCERLLYALIFGGAVLAILVSFLGRTNEGRLAIGTGTLANPNTLALLLLLSACSFIYLIYRGHSSVFTILGVLGISVCVLFLFRTGSRGGFLGVISVVIALGFTVRKASAKLNILAILVVMGLAAFVTATLDPVAFRRLTDIALSDASPVNDAQELYAGSSQQARTELVGRAIDFTLHHPILGVGFGEFPVAVDAAAHARGMRSGWSGTHNTYLQVSSECGIPAALCYIAVLLISIRTSRRLYREFSDRPGEEVIAGLSLTLFAALICLLVTLFFFHMAYTYYVPVICGLTVALNLAAKSHRETV
jgi:O-antigen ligase